MKNMDSFQIRGNLKKKSTGKMKDESIKLHKACNENCFKSRYQKYLCQFFYLWQRQSLKAVDVKWFLMIIHNIQFQAKLHVPQAKLTIRYPIYCNSFYYVYSHANCMPVSIQAILTMCYWLLLFLLNIYTLCLFFCRGQVLVSDVFFEVVSNNSCFPFSCIIDNCINLGLRDTLSNLFCNKTFDGGKQLYQGLLLTPMWPALI